jgi:hypothetical protein
MRLIMDLAARIDEFGKPAWIALTILGFMVWWPAGLAILIYFIGSGRMSCWKRGGWGRWQQNSREQRNHWQARWGGPWGSSSSGNRAFDEYRAETLRRLEEEQREFVEFLDRLRQARDKAEFDQFMAERTRRQQGPGPEPQPQA